MIKGSEKRKADYPINPMFIDRWSPRSMTGEAISKEELMPLFEAARWAPSASNEQPWRFVYAHRDTPHWDTYVSFLFDGNKAWAQKAGVLAVVVSHTYNNMAKMTSLWNSFDAGAAWQNLALQGYQNGFAIHGMGGFDRDKARAALNIPEVYAMEMMIAIGRPGPVENLPESYQVRETPNPRRPLSQTVCEGLFAL
jgi:nitroreductase